MNTTYVFIALTLAYCVGFLVAMALWDRGAVEMPEQEPKPASPWNTLPVLVEPGDDLQMVEWPSDDPIWDESGIDDAVTMPEMDALHAPAMAGHEGK